MHILPNSKIPFSNLPLDILISNRTAALKKKQETSLDEGKGGLSGAAQENNVFMLDEYNFPHAVALHESALKAEPLIATYRKCYMAMGLDRHPGMLFMLIIIFL